MTRNSLYYGDNLAVLREHVAEESVDLVYLDPPFNSNATYNVLFRERTGEESPAQIRAFMDYLGMDAVKLSYTYEREIIGSPVGAVGGQGHDQAAFRQFIGRNDDDGVPGDDDAAAGGAAPSAETDRQPLGCVGGAYIVYESTASHQHKLCL